MTIRQSLEKLGAFLKQAGIENPEIEAEIILAHILAKDRFWLHLNPNSQIEKALEKEAWRIARRRANGEPLAYLTSEKEFWSLPFYVTPATLVPRPETELIVETLLKLAPKSEKELELADLGTGSGIIAVAIAKELPKSWIVAIDKSFRALKVAQRNAMRHGVEKQIAFVASDWLTAIKECGNSGPCFDFIVSNPPYVSTEEAQQLQREVKKFEPGEALFAGKKGTEAVEKIITEAPSHLADEGWLLCEIGWNQGSEIKQFTQLQGRYKNIAIIRDIAGLDRLLVAQKKG